MHCEVPTLDTNGNGLGRCNLWTPAPPKVAEQHGNDYDALQQHGNDYDALQQLVISRSTTGHLHRHQKAAAVSRMLHKLAPE